MELNLPGAVQGLECNVNGYNFRLVRHTLYLRRISEAMDSNLEYRWRKAADYSNVVFTIDVSNHSSISVALAVLVSPSLS